MNAIYLKQYFNNVVLFQIQMQINWKFSLVQNTKLNKICFLKWIYVFVITLTVHKLRPKIHKTLQTSYEPIISQSKFRPTTKFYGFPCLGDAYFFVEYNPNITIEWWAVTCNNGKFQLYHIWQDLIWNAAKSLLRKIYFLI